MNNRIECQECDWADDLNKFISSLVDSDEMNDCPECGSVELQIVDVINKDEIPTDVLQNICWELIGVLNELRKQKNNNPIIDEALSIAADIEAELISLDEERADAETEALPEPRPLSRLEPSNREETWITLMPGETCV